MLIDVYACAITAQLICLFKSKFTPAQERTVYYQRTGLGLVLVLGPHFFGLRCGILLSNL